MKGVARPESRRPGPCSPVLMRYAFSTGSTKIFPSPTSPVDPAYRIARTVGSTKWSETPISSRTLSCSFHLDPRAAVGLHLLRFAAVALDASDRQTAHLGAVERLEHVVQHLGSNDRDHQFHMWLTPRRESE